MPIDAGWPFRAFCRATPVATGVWKVLEDVSTNALPVHSRLEMRLSPRVAVAVAGSCGCGCEPTASTAVDASDEHGRFAWWLAVERDT